MKTVTEKKPNKRRLQKKQTPKPKAGMLSPLNEAIRAKSPIEIIEKLILYEENLKKETARLAYIEAFGELQNELPDLPKVKEQTDKNGKTYKFCPLPLIKEIIQPFLYKFGFSYRWDFKPIEKDKIECICIVTHLAGHQETASMIADRDDSDAMTNLQSIGSSRTYLQRYTIIPAFGLASAEEDNDAGTSTSKITAAISGPQAISKEREALEQMELEELMLKLDREKVQKFIDKEIGEGTIKFTETNKAKIKKFIIDTILER